MEVAAASGRASAIYEEEEDDDTDDDDDGPGGLGGYGCRGAFDGDTEAAGFACAFPRTAHAMGMPRSPPLAAVASPSAGIFESRASTAEYYGPRRSSTAAAAAAVRAQYQVEQFSIGGAAPRGHGGLGLGDGSRSGSPPRLGRARSPPARPGRAGGVSLAFPVLGPLTQLEAAAAATFPEYGHAPPLSPRRVLRVQVLPPTSNPRSAAPAPRLLAA